MRLFAKVKEIGLMPMIFGTVVLGLFCLSNVALADTMEEFAEPSFYCRSKSSQNDYLFLSGRILRGHGRPGFWTVTLRVITREGINGRDFQSDFSGTYRTAHMQSHFSLGGLSVNGESVALVVDMNSQKGEYGDLKLKCFETRPRIWPDDWN